MRAHSAMLPAEQAAFETRLCTVCSAGHSAALHATANMLACGKMCMHCASRTLLRCVVRTGNSKLKYSLIVNIRSEHQTALRLQICRDLISTATSRRLCGGDTSTMQPGAHGNKSLDCTSSNMIVKRCCSRSSQQLVLQGHMRTLVNAVPR